MKTTGIQWLDDLARQRGATPETWNPIRGCRRASAGCENCYAEAIARRFSGNGQPFDGLIDARTGRWNGQIRIVRDRLDAPRHWRKRRVVFVNSAFDLFETAVPDSAIDEIFAIMAGRPDDLFLILTKRAARMHDKLTPHPPRMKTWPLPNVWLGVSVEDQSAADTRIPALLDTPATLRFVSVEPLLGPVDLDRIDLGVGIPDSALRPEAEFWNALDWVIVGGESGGRARPMHPAWRLAIANACEAAGVPFYDKQPGEWAGTEVWAPLTWPVRVDGDTGEIRPLKDSEARPHDAIMSRIGMAKAAQIHPPLRRELPPFNCEARHG